MSTVYALHPQPDGPYNPQTQVCASCSVRQFALFGALDEAALAQIHYRIADLTLEPGQMLYAAQDSGTLSIATTHTQARYVLPEPVAKLRAAWPKVNLSLHQGTPDQVARMLIDETAEVGIATESLSNYEELVTLPCYEWQHVVVVPRGHPLEQGSRLSLEDLAAYPLVTYHPTFTGRTRIDTAFAHRKLEPRIALEAIDSDVITTYVKLGMGIGIVAEMAVRGMPAQAVDGELVIRPLGHLFGQNVTRVAFKRGAYLRNFVYEFAELLSERLSRDLVARAMSGHVADYEL